MGLFYITDYMGLFYISDYMGWLYIRDFMAQFYISGYMRQFFIVTKTVCSTSETTKDFSVSETIWDCPT